MPAVTELANGNIVAVWQNYESGYRKAKYKVFDQSDNLIKSGDSYKMAPMTIFTRRLLIWAMAVLHWIIKSTITFRRRQLATRCGSLIMTANLKEMNFDT